MHLPRTEQPSFRVGLGGSSYVWCIRREPVEEIARAIGKSHHSVYYRPDFGVWVVRVRDKRQKVLLKGLFERNGGQLMLNL